MSDNEIKLNVMMQEYCSLRQEATQCDNTQMTIAGTAFTFFAALIAITVENTIISEQAVSLLAYLAFPCIIMFFCLLWIDQLYRRIRFGTYLRRAEKKILFLIKVINDDKKSIKPIDYEQWISSLDDDKFFLLRTRYIYGYILSGCCIVVPISIPILRNCLFPSGITFFLFYSNHLILFVIFETITIIYYFFLILFIIRLYGLPKKADNIYY